MSKLNSLFDQFLSNIEPNKDAVAYAQEAHKPVRDFLEHDEDFGKYVESTFLYGSYRRHTAVGDIKDVDIVVIINVDPDDEVNTPHKVLRRLKTALARYYDDPENPAYQRRSIRVNDPLPDNPDVSMTLDIIPAVAPNGVDQPLRVPDREAKVWIQSHPKGHIKVMSELNSDEFSGGRFVPLVKIMKAWWKHQCAERQPDVERPQPKGFWIECLTAEMFDPKQTCWADHFIEVLTSISEQYEVASEVPKLRDPGLIGQLIHTSMTLEEFAVFLAAAKDCLALAIAARDHDDPVESSALWREIFGEEFPLHEEPEVAEKAMHVAKPLLGVRPQIQPLRWRRILTKKRRVRIDAFTYIGNIRQQGLNSDGRILPAECYIRFAARTNVRGAYEVYWQVVNTGKHAEERGGLRGELFQARYKDGTPSNDALVNWEHTEFTGKHWIQCFVVQNGYCVAESKKFYVNIKNRNFPV